MIKLCETNSISLLTDQGERTRAGSAVKFAKSSMASHSVENVSPDPYTFAFIAGDRTLILWGEPQTLSVDHQHGTANSAVGEILHDTSETLSTDALVILTSSEPLHFGQYVTCGPGRLVEDSFHDFALLNGGESSGSDPFDRYFDREGERIDLQVRARAAGTGAMWASFIAMWPWVPKRFGSPAR